MYECNKCNQKFNNKFNYERHVSTIMIVLKRKS